MTSGKQERSSQSDGQKVRKTARLPLPAHRAFAPLLGAWGALLGGLVVVVLPPDLVAQAMSGALAGWVGAPGIPLAAGIAAVMLGVPLFLFASALHRRARRPAADPSTAGLAVVIPPIDPSRDLGMASLDDPFETLPLADLATEEPDAAAQTDGPAPDPELVPAPRELELAEFAALPGRNAVWVEEPCNTASCPPEPVAPPAEDKPVRAIAPAREPGTAALERLRSVPPSELSLPQMVERFAAALHEHRQMPPVRPLSAGEVAAREAALSEALRALAALSGETPEAGRVAASGEPLPAALASLGGGRGAA